MPEESPNTVRMPEVKIPFTADLDAVERSIDALEERMVKIADSFGEAMARKFDELEERAARMEKQPGVPGAVLDEIAKQDRGITAAEVLMLHGARSDPMKEILGENHEVVERLDRVLAVLEEIRDYTKAQEPG